MGVGGCGCRSQGRRQRSSTRRGDAMTVSTVTKGTAGETPATEVPLGDGGGRSEVNVIEPVLAIDGTDGAEVAMRGGRHAAVGAVAPASEDWAADAGMTTV